MGVEVVADWTATDAGRRFNLVVLSVLDHHQRRWMVGRVFNLPVMPEKIPKTSTTTFAQVRASEPNPQVKVEGWSMSRTHGLGTECQIPSWRCTGSVNGQHDERGRADGRCPWCMKRVREPVPRPDLKGWRTEADAEYRRHYDPDFGTDPLDNY